MIDNESMASPAQVTQNTTGSTASPTQVTTHTQNSTDTNTKNNYEDENGGERDDDDGDDSVDSPENLGLGCVIRHVETSSSILSGTTCRTLPRPPTREINVNGAAFQSTKIGDKICVTDPIIRRTITRNEDLC